MTQKITASIIGITGYTGLEILRLLLAHPQVEIGHLTSRQHEDTKIGEVYAHLAHLDLRITDTDHKTVAQNSDVVFLALPHKTAQDVVADLHGVTKVIDLSADYRLDDADTYTRYYDVPHNHPDLLKDVVYGLPEIVGKDAVKNASTVANPGCYAALGQFLTFPFKGHIETVDFIGVTGSSGLGKSPSESGHHPVRNHNMRSYGINTHRHIPEIARSAGIAESQINMVPTSGPFTRGIFGQAFITLTDDVDIEACVKNAYQDCPFVRFSNPVALADIVGSNFVDLQFIKGNNGHIIAQGVLDNLVKGAAGSAIQNMNLMCGLEETSGLINLSPVYP